MGVSEQAWLAERCKGLADEDIQAFNEDQNSDASVILGFLLPGSYQWRHKQYSRAVPLSLAFAASIGCFFAFPQEVKQTPHQNADGTVTAETIQSYRPVFLVVTLADMVLSAILTYRANSNRHAPVPPDMQEKEEAPTPPAPEGSFRLDYRDNRPEVRYVVTF